MNTARPPVAEEIETIVSLLKKCAAIDSTLLRSAKKLVVATFNCSLRSQLAVTNSYKPDNRGLISADRNNKATLPLTIPRCTSKSYAKDPSPPV